MSDRKILSGVVLDEGVSLTLREVCEVCGVDRSLVIAMVEEGIAAPLDQESAHWRFSGLAVTRIRTATRLYRDLDVNLAGAALALDLLEEIESLRGARRHKA